MKKFESEA
jgi:hypothetical protein